MCRYILKLGPSFIRTKRWNSTVPLKIIEVTQCSSAISREAAREKNKSNSSSCPLPAETMTIVMCLFYSCICIYLEQKTICFTNTRKNIIDWSSGRYSNYTTPKFIKHDKINRSLTFGEINRDKLQEDNRRLGLEYWNFRNYQKKKKGKLVDNWWQKI